MYSLCFPPLQWKFQDCGKSAKLSALQCFTSSEHFVILYKSGQAGFSKYFAILCGRIKEGWREGGRRKVELTGLLDDQPRIGHEALYAAASSGMIM